MRGGFGVAQSEENASAGCEKEGEGKRQGTWDGGSNVDVAEKDEARISRGLVELVRAVLRGVIVSACRRGVSEGCVYLSLLQRNTGHG